MFDFEPLYSTPSADAVARFLGLNYALAPPLCCRMLNRGFNDVFLLTAATEERYVFRLSHLRACGAADVRTETAFLSHLARLGAPIATPVQTLAGEMFLRAEASEGAREGVLFCALNGRAPKADSFGDARANGITLAKIHNAAEGYSADSPLYRLDLDHLLHLPLARVLNSGVVEVAQARVELEAITARAAKAIAAFNGLTWTHCHGDCHGFNARINEAGEACFFDFDDGGPGYLAYDLSVFLWAQVSFGRKSIVMWHAFIDGYRGVRQINPIDFEAAHWFVIVRHIWLMGEYASRAREWGSEPASWIAR